MSALERAEKAEAAARDFRAALETIAKQDATYRLGDPPWKHWRELAREALATHSDCSECLEEAE